MDYRKTIIPPTEEVERASRLVFDLVVKYMDICNLTDIDFEGLQASQECFLLMSMISRNIEGVIIMAQQDLILLPAAMAVARSAFEMAVRVLWMLNPNDFLDRENRWLSYASNWDHEYYGKSIDLYRKLGADISQLDMQRDQLGRLMGAVRQALDQVTMGKYKRISLPNLREMLISMSEERQYILYQLTSQYAHGSGAAIAGMYREDLDPEGKISDSTCPADWKVPLQLCRYSIYAPGTRFLQIVGRGPFVSVQVVNQTIHAINNIV